jgi:DNA-binding ferritin-like protein
MILAHLCDLHLLGSGAYGYLSAVGGAPTMQLLLDGIVQTVREASDTIGERLHALDAESNCAAKASACPPQGERSSAAMLDRIALRIATLVAIIDNVHGRVVAVDPVTGDLLRAIMRTFAEHAVTLTSKDGRNLWPER